MTHDDTNIPVLDQTELENISDDELLEYFKEIYLRAKYFEKVSERIESEMARRRTL